MIEVRRLDPGDEAEVLRAGKLFEGLEAAALPSFLASPSDHLLVGYCDGEPAGALIAHELPRLDGPPNMILYSVDTDESFRRRGVARTLIEALKTLAGARGCFEIFVLTNASNLPAMALYAATGGRRQGHDDVMWVYDL